MRSMTTIKRNVSLTYRKTPRGKGVNEHLGNSAGIQTQVKAREKILGESERRLQSGTSEEKP